MAKPIDGILNDESVHLYQRALYVEPLPYPLDPDKLPADGIEYIHQVRLEAEAIFPGHRHFYESMPAFEVRAPVSDEEEHEENKSKMPTLSEWKKKESTYFSRLANRLKHNKKELMAKFPCKRFPSIRKEKDVCLFCLGSNLYQKIYNCEKKDEAAGHPPLLSRILHISQEGIFTLLQYMTVWAMITNYDHRVCRWIYALFACLEKPLPDEFEEFLENFYDFCVSRRKFCDKKEENQLYLFTSILENYFCVKAHTIGPPLERFESLC